MRTSGPFGSRLLLIAVTIYLAATVSRADDLAVGARYPLPVTKPGHICVVVVVGYTMNEWFVRNVIEQTQKIADKYGDDVGVELDFTPGDTIEEYYKNAAPPVLHIPVVNLTHYREQALGLNATPMMYIVDGSGIIQKVQIGWTGYSQKRVENKKPWLINSASDCIDKLQGNPAQAAPPN